MIRNKRYDYRTIFGHRGQSVERWEVFDRKIAGTAMASCDSRDAAETIVSALNMCHEARELIRMGCHL